MAVFASKTKQKLSKVPVGCVCATLHLYEEVLRWIVGATRVLDEKQVLPLDCSRHPEIEAQRVNGDIHS